MTETMFRGISLEAHRLTMAIVISLEAQWAARGLAMAIVEMVKSSEPRRVALEKARDDLAQLARLITDDGSIPETVTISVREALEVVDRAVSGEADDPQSLVPALRVAERVAGWADALAHMASAPASNNGRRHHENQYLDRLEQIRTGSAGENAPREGRAAARLCLPRRSRDSVGGVVYLSQHSVP